MSQALRSLGTWAEGTWDVSPDGSQAAKRFTWSHPALVRKTREALTLQYFALARCAPRDLEHLERVAEAERQALGVLEGMVRQTCEGVAYVARVSPEELVSQAVRATVGEWVEHRAFPPDWAARLDRTVAQALQGFVERLQWAEAAGAGVDPAHPEWGWVVPIEPLAVPLIVAG